MAFPDFASLPLPKLAAQTIVVRTTGFLFDYQLQYPQWEADSAQLKHLIQDVGVGGIILLGGSTAEVALKIAQMQRWAAVPLLICADIEEGIGQRFPGATWFPPPMALAGVAKQDLQRAIALAEQMGAAIAQEAMAIGMNWLLTPTVDVNNNPDNPVINVRAFGETPTVVSELTAAYIRGAQQFPVLTTAKHFPGHGDTAIDSHLELPTIAHDLARLNAVELAPFRETIATGVDSVMSAHLNVPALDPDRPTTFSRKVMTDLLRGNMGFDGLIVTDALVMGAIADRYGNAESVVQSIEAGVDVIMMPLDAVGAVAAICQAVESGRLTRTQLEQAVARIWAAKGKVCGGMSMDSTDLIPPIPPVAGGSQTVPRRPRDFEGSSSAVLNQPPITADRLMSQLAQPAAMQTARDIVRESIVCHHPSQFHPVQHGRNLILTDTLLDSRLIGRLSPAVTLPPSQGFIQLELVDQNTPSWHPKHDAPTLLQLFIRGNPLRGIQETVQQAQVIVEQLQQSQQLEALMLYGSPYVLERLISLLADDVPVLFSYGQVPDAQQIALARLFGTATMTKPTKEGMF
jgi:beta-glucosidase